MDLQTWICLLKIAYKKASKGTSIELAITETKPHAFFEVNK